MNRPLALLLATMALLEGCPAPTPPPSDLGGIDHRLDADGEPPDLAKPEPPDLSEVDIILSDRAPSLDDATVPGDMPMRDMAVRDMAQAPPCNAFANAAPPVQQVVSMAAMPMPTGGTIVDGTYFLTSSTIYGGGPKPVELKATRVIQGNAFQSATQIVNAAENRDIVTYRTFGTDLFLTFTCNPGGQGTLSVGYDATNTRLTLYSVGSRTVNVWTRQ